MRALALAGVLLVFPVAIASADVGSRPVLYAADGSNGADVYVDAPAGGDRLSLTGGAGGAVDPAWSPDGSLVAFAGSRDPKTTSGIPGIYVAAPDGSTVRRVTAVNGFAQSPSWSPDGQSIAYLVNNGGAYDVWTVDVASGATRQLTTDGNPKQGASWAPDGSAILYTQGGRSVSKVDLDDGGIHLLANGSAPVWSPDGAHIAYVDSQGKVAVMDADGRNPHELTQMYSSQPAWSPDGQTVVFQAEYVETALPSTRFGPVTRGDLYAAPFEGTAEPRRLTGPFDVLDLTGPRPFAPTFSPDGARIFFRVGEDVWSANADGTCEAPWPGLGRIEEGPFWRPGFVAGGTTCVDLHAHATVDPQQVAPGQAAQVHVTVENHGNRTATHVVLFPDVTQNVGVGGCVGGCALGTLAPGGSAAVSFTIGSQTVGDHVARFGVTSDQGDVTPADSSGFVAIAVLDCTLVGTWGPDHLQGTSGDDHICGLPGPDWISGGRGNDVLDGAAGNDTIFGGPGHDTILGRGGRDVIFARDGQRDYIDCGTEYDVAVVDKLDHVSHCERVLRK